MELNSKNYAKFKRTFIGPKLPRKIRREREIGMAQSMPDEKPPRAGKKGPPSNFDLRSCRFKGLFQLKIFVTPTWANKILIEEIYSEAKNLTKITGVPHEVDHIIPLRGELVCGLHVETNLRIITRDENKAKDNLFSA